MTATSRYAVLGLGYARASWFADVATWANSGALPLEFSKCVSTAEVKQRVAGRQPYSAVLVGIGSPGVDRDFFAVIHAAGMACFAVAHPAQANDLLELGADAVLSPNLTPHELLGALTSHAQLITDVAVENEIAKIEDFAGWTGDLVAVCGSGGAGASTVAIALAQELAQRSLDASLVLLADLARNSDQALLHDAGDIAPGVEELVELHRHRRPTSDEIRALTFEVPERGYQLLLGLRRRSAWTVMSKGNVDSALSGLRRSFRSVVVDISAEFDGEAESGSLDLEERNNLSRLAVQRASCVVVVAQPGMKGLNSLLRTVRDLIALDVSADRIVPVINRSFKRRTLRHELDAALNALGPAATNNLRPPIHISDFPVDGLLRDGSALPRKVSALIGDAVVPVLSLQTATDESLESQRIQPGTMGFAAKASGA